MLSLMTDRPVGSSGRPGKTTLSVCEILDSWADISKAKGTELRETEPLVSDTQVHHVVV